MAVTHILKTAILDLLVHGAWSVFHKHMYYLSFYVTVTVGDS